MANIGLHRANIDTALTEYVPNGYCLSNISGDCTCAMTLRQTLEIRC